MLANEKINAKIIKMINIVAFQNEVELMVGLFEDVRHLTNNVIFRCEIVGKRQRNLFKCLVATLHSLCPPHQTTQTIIEIHKPSFNEDNNK